MARARHRKPSAVKKNVQKAVVVTTTGTALAAGTIAFPTMALAQDASAWIPLIKCESGLRNVENAGPSTASGFFQIVDGTWRGAGGTEFAPRAIDATFEEQAIVAQRIAENRGSLADWNASKPCWGDEIDTSVPSGPAINPFAVPTPAATVPDIDCPQIETREKAQEILDNDPSDPYGLDSDGDGIPCEAKFGEDTNEAPAPVVEEPAPAVETSGGERVVAKAREYFGAEYEWGGESYAEGGFDCSGLVYRVFADLGIDLGVRTSAAMAGVGTEVSSLEQAQPGDLLLFDPDGDGSISHVAIYSGNGKMIDSAQEGDVVREKDVWGTPVTIRRVAVDGEVASEPAESPALVENVAPEAPVVPEGTEEVAYTVVKDDWLSKIAPMYDTTWRELYEDNREVIGDNPNLIYPGQVLTVGGLKLNKAPVTVPDPAAEADDKDPVEQTTAEIEQEAPVDLDCKDIANYDEAQTILVNDTSDPHDLDGDGDGVACEIWFDRDNAPVVEASQAKTSNEVVPGARLTSGMGPRWGTKHNGIDLAAPIGTPVYTPVSGTIIVAGPRDPGGFGQAVYLRTDQGDTVYFGHINSWTVSVGDYVTAGTQVATVGNKGHSTGPHLHLQLNDPALGPIDPEPWLRELGYEV